MPIEVHSSHRVMNGYPERHYNYMEFNITKMNESACRGELSDAHNDFYQGLNSYAFFKVSNHALGEDLVQETFLKTWKYLIKNGKIEGMRAFLYHILNNLIVDEYRKGNRKASSLDDLMERGYDPSAGDYHAFINILDGKVPMKLISKLPLIYKNVLSMRYAQSLTIKEISVLSKQTENTVSMRIYRGIRKLRLLYIK